MHLQLTPEESEEFAKFLKERREKEINLAMCKLHQNIWFGDRDFLYSRVENIIGKKLYKEDKKYIDEYVRRA